MAVIDDFLGELKEHSKPAKSAGAARFFQAYPGGYGEGDQFWGLTVPEQRTICNHYYKLLTLKDLDTLLQHEVHEVRLSALMTLVKQYQKAKQQANKTQAKDLYLKRLEYVNNWDLVDCSAHYILGDWCLAHGHQVLVELAESGHLWKQRVAMISTFAFIRGGDSHVCLQIATLLLDHKHDLIHKAVGWMLRELGNRNFGLEYDFLVKYYSKMPRTMLRYAIEKFDEEMRQRFLKGSI